MSNRLRPRTSGIQNSSECFDLEVVFFRSYLHLYRYSNKIASFCFCPCLILVRIGNPLACRFPFTFLKILTLKILAYPSGVSKTNNVSENYFVAAHPLLPQAIAIGQELRILGSLMMPCRITISRGEDRSRPGSLMSLERCILQVCSLLIWAAAQWVRIALRCIGAMHYDCNSRPFTSPSVQAGSWGEILPLWLTRT